MIGRNPFICFLVDTPSGSCYYRNSNGVTQLSSIHINSAGVDVSLPNLPDGWIGIELGFNRNEKYYGINRSFSVPIKLVKDTAQIVRELMYQGIGIETPLSLVVFKYNDSPSFGDPNYSLYFKAQLDLPRATDIANEGIQVNLIEGGITQLLKSYENTVFEIPCDGSIPENKKIRYDGMLLPDVFNFQVQANQAQKNTSGVGVVDKSYTLPATFINNEGDNFGIIKNDVPYTTLGDPFSQNTSYILKSVRPIKVRIRGSIVARPRDNGLKDEFWLYLRTSKSTTDDPRAGGIMLINNQLISSYQTFSFDQTINLAANEALFICVYHLNYLTDGAFAIESGSFTLEFASMAEETTAWGITAWDLYRLLIQNINKAASTTNQTFNYGVDSTLLQANLSWMVTSGDALRASGDANYGKFYQQYALGNVNGVVNYYGPVIKTSLADFFQTMSTLLFASLGNQQLTGQNETLFFESLGYVFNQNANLMDVGQVSNVKISVDDSLIFNEFETGSAPQTYDQKAGKYEYNTTLKMVGPNKTVQNKFSKLTKYRLDAYGMERLRSGTGGTSTTSNDSDNSVFAVQTDPTLFSFDAEKASFLAQSPLIENNDNIRIAANVSHQPVINMTEINGAYLSLNNDPSIFVFSENNMSGIHTVVVTIQGTMTGNLANSVTGNPIDYIKFTLFINGVPVLTNTTFAPATNFSFQFNPPAQVLKTGDCIYVIAETSITCNANISLANISVDSGAYWTATGVNIPVDQGTPFKLIAMPTVTDSGGNNVHYNFQYFLFNSLIANSPFVSYTFSVLANILLAQDASNNSEHVDLFLFKNGQIIDSKSQFGNHTTANNFTLSAPATVLKIGDIFFLSASATGLNGQIQAADITFNSNIPVVGLLREDYQQLTGVPNLTAKTTDAGAPYNIVDATPKRIMEKWRDYYRPGLQNQNGSIKFNTLSKNQYLSTLDKLGIAVIENADIQIGPYGGLWHPYKLTFTCRVPIMFADLLTAVANSHIKGSINGKDLYGFPLSVKQKVALNEMQEFELRLSPKTNLADLLKLDIDGLNLALMPPNSAFFPTLNPLKWLMLGEVLDPLYHHLNMDEYWFTDQVQTWANTANYYQKWQQNDTISIQCVTNGITPVSVNMYYIPYGGTPILKANVPMVPTLSPAITSGKQLWLGSYHLTNTQEGTYVFLADVGTAGNQLHFITECIEVRADWPNTYLFAYSNKANKYQTTFDTGWTATIRAEALISRYQFEMKMAQFTDQPQDISLLNAYPYRVYTLNLFQIPDWLHEKIGYLFLLDTIFIDKTEYQLDEGAKWEAEVTQGVLTKDWKIPIRLASTINGLTVGATGVISRPSVISTLDAALLGPNANNNGGLGTPDIIGYESN